jgi:hypothetical protein
MIYLHLSGGLGNQLFQYAYGRTLSEETGDGLILDATWYERRIKAAAPRSYDLPRYSIRGTRATGLRAMQCRLQMSRAVRWVPPLAPFTWVRESSIYRYSPPLKPPGDIYALGNWQSYKYFEAMRGPLRGELTPRDPMGAMDAAIAERIGCAESVSLHVRRGDFVASDVARQIHGVCGADYYERAIRYVIERVPAAEFFVFTDDPDWAETHLNCGAPITVLRHNGPEMAFQDLRLMALCRHHITANSSFSWWGAWLGGDGIVVCPSEWIVGWRTADLDIVPPHWSII